MIGAKLELVADEILKINPLFSNGFTDVIQDDETGIVHGNSPVFPADNLGDYFYLRIPDSGKFIITPSVRVSDCAQGYTTSSDIILVAVVENAEPDALLYNLATTLSQTAIDGVGITLKSFIHQSGVVIRQELAKVSEGTTIAKALQTQDKYNAIVSISFTLTDRMIFTKSSCLTSPCKEC